MVSINRKVAGYVYIIQHGDTDHYKIGHTINRPMARLRELQAGTPIELKMYEVFYVADAMRGEVDVHHLLRKKRVRGEWFKLNQWELDQVMLLLESEVYVYYDEMELYYALQDGRRAIRTLGDYGYGDVIPEDVEEAPQSAAST